MKARALAGRTATAVVVGAGLLFVALTIRENWAEIGAYEWQARWGRMGLSLLVMAASLVFGTWIWKRVLDRFPAARTTFPELLRISFLSKVARYIPGKVWQFVAVGQLSERTGGSPRVAVSSMVVHAAFDLLAALIVASVIAARRVEVLPSDPVFAIGSASVLALVAAHPRLIEAGLGLLARVAGQDRIAWRGRWRDSVEVLLLSIASWAGLGIAFFLFVGSLVRVGPGDLLPLVGINAFAFVAGYVVIVAPAGAGVREATMAGLLGRLVPAGAAAVVAILARLWTIAAELLTLGVVLLLFPGGDGGGAEPGGPATDPAGGRSPPDTRGSSSR